MTSWTILTENYLDDDKCYVTSYEIKGDTTINDLKYKKLYCNDKFKGAVRETQDSLIYYYDDNVYNRQEYLLYDFSWKVGKVLYSIDLGDWDPVSEGHPTYVYATIDKIDTVTLENGEKCAYISTSTGEKCFQGIGDTEGFTAHLNRLVADYRSKLWCAIEKTNGDEDWGDNFNFPKQLYDSFTWEGHEIKLYVHTGWGNMYHALKHDMHVDFEEVMNEHPDAYVESIGWSLGSGEAQLGVQDLNYKYHIKPYLYTYGSVNPFWYAPNDKVTAAYLQSTFEVGYNFCHKSDIVTYQPPFPCYHMLNRVNVGKFHPVGLLDPWKYHTMYDNAELYKDIA
jgi:hypothetical protein